MSSQPSQRTQTTTEKEKASWDMEHTRIFIEACLTQIGNGERNGTTLSKKGWVAVGDQFRNETGRNYNKTQLKNRWDQLRKDWLLFSKLIEHETGLGWNTQRNTVDASNEWWEAKIAENKDYQRFRSKGCPFYHQMTILFKDVVATGEHVWVPSSGLMPGQLPNSDDCYRPSTHHLDNIDVEEGSGDSEEDLQTGATIEMETIRLDDSHENRSQRSGEKRKRAVGRDARGKAKVPATQQLIDVVSIIAQSSQSRSETVKEYVSGPTGTSPMEISEALLQIPEVASDLDFYGDCCLALTNKVCRELFFGTQSDEHRVAFLRRCVANLSQLIGEKGK